VNTRKKKYERIFKSVGFLHGHDDHLLGAYTAYKQLDHAVEWSTSDVVWNGTMSQENQDDQEPEKDPVEEVVKHIHIVIPVVGAVLIFMLATIAITMA
jgi:hypothetical protein